MASRKTSLQPGHTKLPEKVPVFALPNVILFPSVELPFYIFEPRYRQMLKDCASRDKFLAISLLKQGWESKKEPVPSHEIVGVGYVRAVFDNPDGTSHILLRGVGRAEIIRYVQLEPYRIAKIRELPDRIEDGRELSRLCEKLRRLLMQKMRLLSENPSRRMRFPKELRNPIALSHIASFLAQASPYLKQDLLETTNCNCRMRHLIGLYQEEIRPPGTQN